MAFPSSIASNFRKSIT